MFEEGLQMMLDHIFGQNIVDNLLNVLSFDILTSPSVQTKISVIYDDVFMPVAMYILVIYFLVNLIDKSLMLEHMDTSQIVKQLFILGGCYMLLAHGFEVLGWLLQGGNAILSDLGARVSHDSTIITGPDAADFLSQIGVSSGFLGLGYLVGIVFTVIPWIFSLFVPVVFKFVCYSRIIEIGVRMAMMPVSLVDFFNNGLAGSGWRNMKAFLAVAMQTATLFVIVVIFSIIMSGVIAASLAGFDLLMAMVAVELACMGLAIKSQSLTKEIIGV